MLSRSSGEHSAGRLRSDSLEFSIPSRGLRTSQPPRLWCFSTPANKIANRDSISKEARTPCGSQEGPLRKFEFVFFFFRFDFFFFYQERTFVGHACCVCSPCAKDGEEQTKQKRKASPRSRFWSKLAARVSTIRLLAALRGNNTGYMRRYRHEQTWRYEEVTIALYRKNK